jgi:hypothetical protein
MPPQLQGYIADKLHSVFEGDPPLRPRRGRKVHPNIRRNYAIVMAVVDLASSGFHPTRNSGTARESACSIVAEALKRLDNNLSEASVNKIWHEYSRLAEATSFA